MAPGKAVMVSSYTKRIRNESNKTFGGWYLDEACTQKPTFTILDTSMNQYYKPDKNVTLYAKWVDYSKDSAVKLESDMTLGIGQKGKITIKSDLKDARVTYHLMRISYGSTNTRREMPVVIDNTGVVIGQAEGSVLMCVDVNGVISNSITLTVSSEAADASIELTADKTTISKDDVIEIKAIVTPETLENSTFVWKSSNEKAAKVEGMGTTAKVTGLGEGTTEISASVGKLTAKITITVVDPVTVSKDSIFLTNIEGAKDSFVVTVKDHTQEESAVTAVLYNNSEEEADFAEITAQSQSYNGGVGTYTFQVLPKSVGEGYIRITTAKGRYALVNIKVSDLQQAMPVSMYGQDVAEVEETDGAVTNGTKISLYSETRGSVIRYKAEYSLDNSFAEIKAEDLTEEYLDPISISWSSTEGFVRITAMVSKEGLADSDIVSMVFSIDNSDAWLDVYEEDRDLFDDNFENVKNSGLIFGHIPTNIPYTGEEITFSNEDIRVYFNGRLLTAGKDYKVVYANNLNAASAPESLNGLTDSQKNRLPRVSVSAIGKYDGKIIRYFSILKRSINDTYVGSNGEITAVAEKFKSVSDPVVRFDLSDGNAKTLKAGKDYEVFYNRIDGETVDYSKALTAVELKSEILDRAAKKLAPYSYVINFRGIGNFEGDYETDAVGIGAAPRLTIISEQDVKDGILQLGNAKLSKKVPTMVYTRDAEDEAKVLSKDIAKLLSSGDIQVKVGKTVINYAEDESKIKSDGYYFEIVDPADNDAAINRYPGSNNFLVLRATPMSEGSAYSNKLVGDYRVAFTITGTKINARFVASSVAYTGEPLLVYEEEEDNFILNRAKSLLNIFSNDKKAANAGAKTAQAYIQNGKEVKVLADDEYNMYAENDIGAAGTVTVVFEGVNQKGIIGKVTKKIKVAAKKITSSDKNLVVNFDEYVNPDDVPYSKTGAAPGVIVSYNGQELVEGRDFTVSYASNTKVGATGKVNLKFTGNYSGTVKAIKTFKVGKGEFNTVNIDADSKDKAYKEKADGYFKSVPALSDNGKKLSLNKDYKIVDAPVYTYAEDIIEKDKNGNTTYIRTAGMEIPDDEIVHLGAVIRVRFTAIPTEKSSYKAAQYGGKDAPTEFTCEYTIGSVDLSKCSVKIADQYYAGGEGIEPAKTDITVKYGKTILDPTDFEIYRIDNNTEVGTATIILQGNGTYFGTKKATFKIKKGIVK